MRAWRTAIVQKQDASVNRLLWKDLLFKVVVHGRRDVDVLIDMSVSRKIRLVNAVCGK